ncbi:MAG: hypothetical protein H2057_02060 [Alphaproteobacteria bacterium]|nr:hypothetical protein [Alphaproteobacteria bacterium]
MTQTSSFIRTVFFMLAFSVVTDKGITSSESALFEPELSALRDAKATFANTLDFSDLKSAVLAAHTLNKAIRTHLIAQPTLDAMTGDVSHDVTELDEGIKDLKICGQEQVQKVSSAWYHYDEKTKELTKDMSTEQETALKQVDGLYKNRKNVAFVSNSLIILINSIMRA